VYCFAIAGGLVPLFGVCAGWLLPNLTNYDFGRSKHERDDGGTSAIIPIASKKMLGIGYVRTW
jgi:hypothetical protein